MRPIRITKTVVDGKMLTVCTVYTSTGMPIVSATRHDPKNEAGQIAITPITHGRAMPRKRSLQLANIRLARSMLWSFADTVPELVDCDMTDHVMISLEYRGNGKPMAYWVHSESIDSGLTRLLP